MTTIGSGFKAGSFARPGLFVAALLLALPAFGGAAMADEDCNWYALKSAKQQQQNEGNNCGFKGDGWTTDQDTHLTYCQGVAPEEWRKAVTDREKQLKACG